MESISNKFGYNRGAIILDAFSIVTNHDQQELSSTDRDTLEQAVDDIMLVLGRMEGLTFVEFEVLVAYAARIDPTEQLNFLDTLVDIIRASRKVDSFTEYDKKFLNFVEGIRNGLAAARGANFGVSVQPWQNAHIAPYVHDQGLAAVDFMQAPSGETTRTWKSEFEEVSEAGTYTRSVVETVTGDTSMSGGFYTTMSMTSSSFTPSNVPMLDSCETSVDIKQSIEDSAEMTPEGGFDEGRFRSTLEGMSSLRFESEPPVHLPYWMA
ncbi:uncharacterized protein BKA55DRAFT_544177 [Fusarium redolens]|uniref:Uncharacterized protein n=1 Tax=Fusarium redolens TaxID=48865 RepID=A0A9P9G8M0_FUSRE|nr:uncharacterized protein BKA55DRAFT_544177 [Fusarium redolens]KAH7234993.1 hypothetical protein BKA55DRAFT_544177 [Fusarium redolens]